MDHDTLRVEPMSRRNSRRALDMSSYRHIASSASPEHRLALRPKLDPSSGYFLRFHRSTDTLPVPCSYRISTYDSVSKSICPNTHSDFPIKLTNGALSLKCCELIHLVKWHVLRSKRKR